MHCGGEPEFVHAYAVGAKEQQPCLRAILLSSNRISGQTYVKYIIGCCPCKCGVSEIILKDLKDPKLELCIV